MKRLLLALLALTALPAWAGAQGGSATWSAVGLRVDKPLPKQFDQNLVSSGVSISLVLQVPGKHIIGLDYPACKLDSAVDDKGTDLLPDPKKTPLLPQAFWPDFRSAQVEPSSFLVQVKAPHLPAQGAGKVRFKGSAVVLYGVKPKTVEVKDVALQKSKKIDVGPATLALDALQNPGETVVMVKSPVPIQSVAFLSAAGEVLPHTGGVLELYFGKIEYQGHYRLKGKVESATVRFSYFEDRDRLTVPLDIEVGLGL
jgi:hypothetical protein